MQIKLISLLISFNLFIFALAASHKNRTDTISSNSLCFRSSPNEKQNHVGGIIYPATTSEDTAAVDGYDKSYFNGGVDDVATGGGGSGGYGKGSDAGSGSRNSGYGGGTSSAAAATSCGSSGCSQTLSSGAAATFFVANPARHSSGYSQNLGSGVAADADAGDTDDLCDSGGSGGYIQGSGTGVGFDAAAAAGPGPGPGDYGQGSGAYGSGGYNSDAGSTTATNALDAVDENINGTV